MIFTELQCKSIIIRLFINDKMSHKYHLTNVFQKSLKYFAL